MQLGNFYRVETCHGTLLGCDARSGEVVACDPERCGAERQILFAHVAAAEPRTCFLISPVRGSALRMPPDEVGSAIIPLRLERRGRDPLVALRDPISGRYVSAAPADAADFGPVRIDKREADRWETLRLVPAADIFLPVELIGCAVQLERMLGAASTANSLAALLDAGSAPAGAAEQIAADAASARAMLEAAARLLSVHRIAWYAESLLHDPAALQRLRQTYPGDIWASEGIPELLSWMAARRTPPAHLGATVLPAAGSRFWRVFGKSGAEAGPATRKPRSEALPAASPQRIALGPHFDFLTNGEYGGAHVSLPHACNAMLRRTVQPRRDVCIVATARNEGLYLLEWIAYHRAIGVDAIFLYSNDNDDGSDELLAPLADAGIITWIDNRPGPGAKPQIKAYRHALGLLPQVLDYRWALIVDLDEFFVFDSKKFASIDQYVRWQEDRHPVDAIALNWVVFSPCGEARWRDDPVIRRFPRVHGGAAPLFKSLFRPRLFINSNPHFPNAYRWQPFTQRDAAGEPFRSQSAHPALSENPRSEMAWINQYFFKSAEEYLWKWSKNRTDPASATSAARGSALTQSYLSLFMEHFEAPVARDDRIAGCAMQLDRELGALNAVTGVAKAAANVRKIFRSRMNEIEKSAHLIPAIAESGELGRRFLETLGLVGAGA